MKIFKHESWQLENLRCWQPGQRSGQQECHYSQDMWEGGAHVFLYVLLLNILMGIKAED